MAPSNYRIKRTNSEDFPWKVSRGRYHNVKGKKTWVEDQEVLQCRTKEQAVLYLKAFKEIRD